MIGSMTQFWRLLLWDFRLQRLYYFWLTAVIIAAVWLLILLSLQVEDRLVWLPVLIFADIGNLGLLFIAGILFLERAQGTLHAVAVMPVSHGLWLTSKLASLTLLGSACACAIVLLSRVEPSWPLMLPAIVLNAALFTSIGFVLASPFEKILNYFFAMALVLALLNIPLLDYFQIVSHPAMWLLPSHAALKLLALGFSGEFGMSYLLATLVLLCWLLLFHYGGVLAHRHFLSTHGA